MNKYLYMTAKLVVFVAILFSTNYTLLILAEGMFGTLNFDLVMGLSGASIVFAGFMTDKVLFKSGNFQKAVEAFSG
jgi:hypothetical protein